MSNSRSDELALNDLTIGGDNSSGAFTPAVQVAASRGAFFRKAGVTKADVVNDVQNITVSTISIALVDEASTARAAELVLTQNLSSEASLARVHEVDISNTLVAKASTARAAELVLTQNLSTEVVDRTNAVSTCLATAQSYTDQKIGDLINGAPGVLDTLKELADALGGDQNFATTMLNNYSTLSGAISNEVVRAGSYETVLSTSISAEVVDRVVTVSTEMSRAVAAELSLSTRVSTETSVSRSAELSLGTSVSAEATTARAAELSLTTRVSAETVRAVGAELSLTTRVSTEEVARAAGDLSLQTRFSGEVSAEISRAGVAELSLGTAVSAEATAARAAELSLQSRFSIEVFNEASTARSAELSLTTRMSIEEDTRATAIASAISTEVVDRNNAISTAASATLAGANQYTDGALSTEILNRNAAISVALASANSYTDGSVNSLSTAIAQDIDDLSVETSTNLSTAIATEVISRNSAISTAVNGLSAAVSMALADEASTARSAEISLAVLLSNQISMTINDISSGISTEIYECLTYQNTAGVKFNAIQQAFDVIFDAIDIEKYQGSAPDYFHYDATLQNNGGSPAPTPAYVDIQINDSVQGTIVSGQNISYNNDLNFTINLINNGTSPSYSLAYSVEMDGVLQNTYSTNIFTIPVLYDNVNHLYTIKLINTSSNSVVLSKSFNWISVIDNVVWTLNSYNGNVNVSPYINETAINSSTYTITEQNNFIFSVNKNISGFTSVININAGGYTSINGTNGIFGALESTTFDKNVDIPITLSIVNSVTNSVITSLSLNIHWVQVTLQAKMATYFETTQLTIMNQDIDENGNIYMIGSYISGSTVTLKNASGTTPVNSDITLPSSVFNEAFIVKYNSSGVVQWATSINGTSNDVGNSITLDSDNNIYIIGRYNSTSTITLKNASGISQVNSDITLPAANAAFIVKYNSSGVVQWATSIDGTGNDIGNSITLDSDNNIYVTGGYNSTSTITLKNASGISQVNSDITLPAANAAFIVKYNSSGVAQWATSIDGTFSDSGNSITLDSDNNIYVAGRYYSTSTTILKNASGISQVNSDITLPSSLLNAAFIVKYNSSGVAQWATSIDGTGNDIGNSITLDSDNNIYVTGGYNSTSTITLKNASGISQVNSDITLPAANAAFIVKYNSSGVVQWATSIDGTGNDIGNSITLDSDNNIYVTGGYNSTSTITLKNASGISQVNSDITLPAANAAFIVKYNSSGVAQLATFIKNSYISMISNSCLFKNGDLFVGFSGASSSGTSTTSTIYDSLGNSQIPSQVTLPTVSANRNMGGFVKYHMYDYQQPYDVIMKASLNGGEFLTFEENPKLSFNPNESLQFQAFITKNVTNNRTTDYSMSMSKSSTFDINEGVHGVGKEFINNIPVFTFNKNNFLYNPLSSGEIVYFRLKIIERIDEYDFIIPTTLYFSTIVN